MTGPSITDMLTANPGVITRRLAEMAEAKAFSDAWPYRRVWVGDILARETGRERGRGWFHAGEHRAHWESRTVADIKAELAREPVHVATRMVRVHVYGVTDGGQPVAQLNDGTLTLCVPKGPPGEAYIDG